MTLAALSIRLVIAAAIVVALGLALIAAAMDFGGGEA